MQFDTILILIALSLISFGVISKKIERSSITAPMIFTGIGIVLTSIVSTWAEHDAYDTILHYLAEITLVLILFTDASRIQLTLLFRDHNIPIRLLGIGLPLTIILGVLIAKIIFPSMTWIELALLGTILAPTDAALGQAVVSSPLVPVRIRQALNIESGLNDGIVFPVVLLLISLLLQESQQSTGYWLQFFVIQIGVSPIVGILIGYSAAKVVYWASKRQWMSESFQKLSILGIAFLAYAISDFLGFNGFIAAFIAGMTVGNTTRELCGCIFDFAETEGQFLNLMVFLIFGALMVPHAIEQITFNTLLYALLSLTVIRMFPVALSLLGLRLQLNSILFLGWFGPRGIASVLFLLLLLHEAHGLERLEPIVATVELTVLLSIFAHGILAYPWAKLYNQQTQQESLEMGSVSEMPTRIQYRKNK